MHRKAFCYQPSGKAAARLTDRLQMVTPFPHAAHFFKDTVLLPAEAGGSLGMNNT